MTRIYVCITDSVFMIEFQGHATGSPETRSGISSLMYALEGFLVNHEAEIEDHQASIPEDNTDALTMIRFSTHSERVKGAFELVLIGLLQIEKSYPAYCKVTIV